MLPPGSDYLFIWHYYMIILRSSPYRWLYVGLLLLPLLVAQPAAGQDTETAALQVFGAPPDLERNIRALVSLPSQSCETQPRALTRFLPGIGQQIERASRALGYYHLTHTTQFIPGDNCWALQISVDAGTAVLVESVNVDLTSDVELFDDTLGNLSLQPGDQLNHGLYERIKSDLSARAVELGFMSARFVESQLALDLQRNTASVNVTFQPGDRYRFGAVQIEPVPALSEEFIRRYIAFSADSYYSTSALIDLRNSLSDSFYFRNVTVNPALDQVVDQRIPVRVGLQLRPRRVYSAGIGVTTDIGPRVRLDFEDRYLNTHGHRFELRSGASPVQQSIDLSYAVPWTNPATERLTYSGGYLHEDNDTYILNTTKLGVTYTFINRSGWRQNYFINYQHDVSELVDSDQEVSDMLIPGISLARTRADDALYPSRGWFLFAELRGASDAVMSTESFVQLNLRGKYIHSVGPGRVLVKFEAGTTVTDAIENLPASIQYFTGGDQSVRGYKYQSLGPISEEEVLTGGKHLLVGGIEYDFNILPNWKLAIFADAGNAFLDFDDYDLKRSAGIGVRWLSPLGPIRVDLAKALDDDHNLRLHLTMGPDL